MDAARLRLAEPTVVNSCPGDRLALFGITWHLESNRRIFRKNAVGNRIICEV